MITSFIQYLLMAPSYINVLNVYAVSQVPYRIRFNLTDHLSYSLPMFSEFADRTDIIARLIDLFYFSDVSWGTKGDNKISTDLGVVATTGKNKNEVEVEVPSAETDINAAYEDAIAVLSTKPPKSDPKPDPATEQEDYYRNFRTK